MAETLGPFIAQNESVFEDSSLPANPHAEASLLSALMNHDDAWDQIAGILTFADFYEKRNQVLFACMTNRADKGVSIHPDELASELAQQGVLDAAGGYPRLADLANMKSIGNVIEKATSIHNYALQRSLISICEQGAQYAMDGSREFREAYQTVSEKLLNLQEAMRGNLDEYMIGSHLDHIKELREYIDKYGHSKYGVRSGFNSIDNVTNGFQPGDLVVVAARPRVGKTTFAMNVAENVALGSKPAPVLFFSMEQPASQLLMRLLSSMANVDQKTIRTSRMSNDENDRFNSAMVRLESDQAENLIIDDNSALNVNDISVRAREVKRRMHGLGLIIVDYIGLMANVEVNRNTNRANEIAQISRGLKQVARELDVPLVALSQLNREAEKRLDKRPRLYDLRDSGAIEQDADVVILLYREDVDKEDTVAGYVPNRKAEINIAKHRHGETAMINMTFYGEQCKFEDLDIADVTIDPQSSSAPAAAMADNSVYV